MQAWLAGFAALIVDKLFARIFTAISEYIKAMQDERAMKKKIAEKIKEIQSEKDPQTRAKRMSDFLDS